jgi:serine/threonine-protein kinase RsbT
MRQITCSIKREVDVYVTMSRARELGREIGFNEVDRTRIEIVILELTRNLLVHAASGTIRLSQLDDPVNGPGLAVEAIDEGPGIPDVELALQDGWSTARTLGAGLPGVRRLMDEFSIDSTVGVGTTVRAVKWLKPPQRRVIYGS